MKITKRRLAQIERKWNAALDSLEKAAEHGDDPTKVLALASKLRIRVRRDVGNVIADLSVEEDTENA